MTAASIEDALIEFTGCIGAALPDICSYSLTIGEAYVPFTPDPDDGCVDEEEACSQAWVRVMQVHPEQGGQRNMDNDECDLVLVAELEVGVLRCFGIEEGGEAPSASEVLVAAVQAMDDMKAVHAAAMACEVWNAISTGEWTPSGPLGGQYGGTWSFTVELPYECLTVSGNGSF